MRIPQNPICVGSLLGNYMTLCVLIFFQKFPACKVIPYRTHGVNFAYNPYTHKRKNFTWQTKYNFYLVTVQIHKSWECTIDFVFKPVIHTTTIAQWGEIISKVETDTCQIFFRFVFTILNFLVKT